MITALWTYEWLFEAPNCTSPSFLKGGHFIEWGLVKICVKVVSTFSPSLSTPVAALEQGTEPSAATVELLSGRRVHHYSKVRSVQNVTLSGNKDRNLNHQ